MSNRLFQGIIHQMRDSIDRVIGVVDDTATVIACSDLTRIGETSEYLMLDMGENQDQFVRDGYTYKPFGSQSKPEFAVFVEGSDETGLPVLRDPGSGTVRHQAVLRRKVRPQQLHQERHPGQHPARRYLCQGAGAALQLRMSTASCC